NGNVNVNSDGSFTYTPNSNFSGTDTFGYNVTDGNLASSTALISINVGALTADNASYSTYMDQLLAANAPGLLAGNETTNLPTTVVLNSSPANGNVTLNTDGSFSYTPNPGYIGADAFTYHLTDGTNSSNVAAVSINVQSPPPVVFGHYYSTVPGQSL